MIKGCEKRVVFVKGEEEGMFECAYFVLKALPKYEKYNEDDMVAEAMKIIEERVRKDVKIRNKEKKGGAENKKIIIPFSVGAAVGSLAGLFWLFL